jgi:beta-lactam-binding protein with PASTA domain
MKTSVQGTDTSDWPGPPSAMLGGGGDSGSQGTGVPDVTGQSIAAAFSILSQAGFQPQVGNSVDSGVAAGQVASTTPGAGSDAQPGDTVVVHPSNGRGGGTGQGNTRGRGKRKGPNPPPRT